LHEVELTARGYSDLGQHGLSLDRDMVLPDFADPSKKVWPPYEVPLYRAGASREKVLMTGLMVTI
jgi:hypothetical protein